MSSTTTHCNIPSASAEALSQRTTHDRASNTTGNQKCNNGPFGAAIPTVQELPIVSVERNETTRTETVQLIISWLTSQGYTSSAQVLREEATAQLRTEHNNRKTVRSLCRSIRECNWEEATKSMKKLQASSASEGPTAPSLVSRGPQNQLSVLLPSLPMLLAQQQFLELVDENDAQRSFAFFMRSIKPFEPTLRREHFQRLTYLLTCRSVAEASSQYPEYRGWIPEVGRSELLALVGNAAAAGSAGVSQYCHQANISLMRTSSGSDAICTLNDIIDESLSYRLLRSRAASSFLWRAPSTAVTVGSILSSFDEQLPPCEKLMRVDVAAIIAARFSCTQAVSPTAAARLRSSFGNQQAQRLTACVPYLDVPAFAASTAVGLVLWVPLASRGCGGDGLTTTTPQLLYDHKCTIRGMCKEGPRLLLWGGCQAVILSLVCMLERPSGNSAPYLAPGGGTISPLAMELSLHQGPATYDIVTNVFTHTSETYSACLFPCGTIAATGLSEGTITLWDVLSGGKMYESNFSSSAIVAITSNRTGTNFYAASKDGQVRVVDVVTGILTFSLSPPIVAEVSSIALSPSSTILVCSYRGGTVRLWDVVTGVMLPYRLVGLENNTKTNVPVSFGAIDTFLFSGSETGDVGFWNLGGVAALAGVEGGREERMASDNVVTNGEIGGVATAWPKGIVLRPTSMLRLHTGPVTGIAVEPSFLLSCGSDGIVCVCTNQSRVGR